MNSPIKFQRLSDFYGFNVQFEFDLGDVRRQRRRRRRRPLALDDAHLLLCDERPALGRQRPQRHGFQSRHSAAATDGVPAGRKTDLVERARDDIDAFFSWVFGVHSWFGKETMSKSFKHFSRVLVAGYFSPFEAKVFVTGLMGWADNLQWKKMYKDNEGEGREVAGGSRPKVFENIFSNFPRHSLKGSPRTSVSSSSSSLTMAAKVHWEAVRRS